MPGLSAKEIWNNVMLSFFIKSENGEICTQAVRAYCAKRHSRHCECVCVYVIVSANVGERAGLR